MTSPRHASDQDASPMVSHDRTGWGEGLLIYIIPVTKAMEGH